jgi:hypothetical protein
MVAETFEMETAVGFCLVSKRSVTVGLEADVAEIALRSISRTLTAAEETKVGIRN